MINDSIMVIIIEGITVDAVIVINVGFTIVTDAVTIGCVVVNVVTDGVVVVIGVEDTISVVVGIVAVVSDKMNIIVTTTFNVRSATHLKTSDVYFFIGLATNSVDATTVYSITITDGCRMLVCLKLMIMHLTIMVEISIAYCSELVLMQSHVMSR